MRQLHVYFITKLVFAFAFLGLTVYGSYIMMTQPDAFKCLATVLSLLSVGILGSAALKDLEEIRIRKQENK